MLTQKQIKFIKSLSIKKNRDYHNCFVVEGEKLVEELIYSKYEILKIYSTNDWKKKTHKTISISNHDLKKISNFKTPNKVLAIVRIQNNKVKNTGNITLILDDIQDPGNFGTIIRLCDWFNVREIICSEKTVDLYNPKVIQATMGSIFRVKINYTNILNYIKKIKNPIYASSLSGENIKELNISKKIHLIIGNESNGISKDVLGKVTKKITIKRHNKNSESLNVATATGILLHELSK